MKLVSVVDRCSDAMRYGVVTYVINLSYVRDVLYVPLVTPSMEAYTYKYAPYGSTYVHTYR